MLFDDEADLAELLKALLKQCIDVELAQVGQVSFHCLAQAGRDTALMRGAMGVLADRHVTPVDHLLGGPT